MTGPCHSTSTQYRKTGCSLLHIERFKMLINLSSRGLTRSLQDALHAAQEESVIVDMDEVSIGPGQATAMKHLRQLFKCRKVTLKNGSISIEPAAPIYVGGDIKLYDMEIENVEYSVAAPPACMFVVNNEAHLELVDVKLHGGAERKKVCPIMIEEGGKLTTSGKAEWTGTGPMFEDEAVKKAEQKAKEQQQAAEAAAAAAAVVASTKPAPTPAPPALPIMPPGTAQLATVMRTLAANQQSSAAAASPQTLQQLQFLVSLLQAQSNPAQIPLIIQLQTVIRQLQVAQLRQQAHASQPAQPAAEANGGFQVQPTSTPMELGPLTALLQSDHAMPQQHSGLQPAEANKAKRDLDLSGDVVDELGPDAKRSKDL